ncbi:MAG: hypothetical protein JOZ07_12840 [Solirubrobacterales bacterium]|nr:hypothetical protein [Solirubrobacterales bacterium]
MPEPSILDARLAEIDRRLRMIQSGLEPVADPEPVAPDEEPTLPTPLRAPWAGRDFEDAEGGEELTDGLEGLAVHLRELATAQERLVALTRELLAEHADVLSRAAPLVDLVAGPFGSVEALREFERTLSELPQVREVTVREFSGDERAVLDVMLAPPSA